MPRAIYIGVFAKNEQPTTKIYSAFAEAVENSKYFDFSRASLDSTDEKKIREAKVIVIEGDVPSQTISALSSLWGKKAVIVLREDSGMFSPRDLETMKKNLTWFLDELS